MKKKILHLIGLATFSIQNVVAKENTLSEKISNDFFDNPEVPDNEFVMSKNFYSGLYYFFDIKRMIDLNNEIGIKETSLYKKNYTDTIAFDNLIIYALKKTLTHSEEKAKNLKKITNITKLYKINNDEIHFYIAYLNIELENYEKAKEELLKISNQSSRENYYLAYVNFKNEDSVNALKNLKKIDTNEYEEESIILKAHIFYKDRNFKALNSFLEEIIKNKTESNLKSSLEVLSAEGKFFNKKYNEALPFYEKYLKENDNEDNLILYRVGSIYYQMNNFAQAMDFFSKISLDDSRITQLACYYSGVINFKNKKIQEALVNFDTARGENFDKNISEKASFEVVNINFYLENYDAAVEASLKHLSRYKNSKHEKEILKILKILITKIENYDLILEKIESSPYLVKLLSKIYQRVIIKKTYANLQEDKLSEATINIERIFDRLNPSDISEEAMILKGIILQLNFKFEDSLSLYEKLITKRNISPRNYDLALYYLGISYLKLGNVSMSSSLFERVKKSKNLSEEQHQDLILQTAHLHLFQKNLVKALSLYEKYDGKKEDIKNFHIALIYSLQEKFTEAHLFYKKIVNIDSGIFVEAKLNSGNIYLQENKFSDALQEFSEIKEENISEDLYERVLLARAMANFKLERYKEAKDLYKIIIAKSNNRDKTITKNSNRENAYLGLKELLIAIGDVDGLEELSIEYKKENENSSKLSLLSSGKSMFFNQNYDQAIVLLKKFIEKNEAEEEKEEAYFFLGESYLAKGKFNEAKPFYEKSKSLKGEIRLANGFFVEKNFSEAEKRYKNLLIKEISDREKINFSEKLGRVYFYQKNLNKSKELFEKLLNMSGVKSNMKDDIILFLSKIAFEQKKYPEALKYISKIDKSQNSEVAAEGVFLESKVLYEQKNYDLAMDKLHQFNKQFYNYKDLREKAFIIIARILIEKKQAFQAKATLLSLSSNTENPEIKTEVAKLLQSDIFSEKVKEGL